MDLMNLKLQKTLQEKRSDFIDSLRLSGIDVKRGNWSTDTVNKNAQVGALSLIQFASQDGIPEQCRNTFLQTVAKNLNEEECASVMAWIYVGFVWTGHFPPYAIVQHMVDPALFRDCCVSLQKYLNLYLQGYFTPNANIF